MQSRIFQTLLITATLGLGIPTENAHGSSCDTCVCHSNVDKNTDVGALINTGFTNGSESCTKVCEHNFKGKTGYADNTCYSTGKSFTLNPSNAPQIDCSQSTNISECKIL